MNNQLAGKTSELVKSGSEYRSIKWDNRPRLAEVGKIKIGGKGAERTKKDGTGTYRIPHFTDHFVVTTTERDKNGDFIPNKSIMDKIGANCKELPIMLLYDDIELNFPTYYAYYKGGTAWCRGNGESAARLNMQTGELTNVPCTCEFLEAESGRCKPHAILSAVLMDANVLGGVYNFRTASWYTIQNIRSSLEFIKTLTGGILARIPLKLKLQMTQVQPKGGQSKTVPICTVVYEAKAGDHVVKSLYDDVVKIAEARKEFALEFRKMEDERRKALMAPESVREATDITQEWQPQNQTHHPRGPEDAPQVEEIVEKRTGEKVSNDPPTDPLNDRINAAFKALNLPLEVEKVIRDTSDDRERLLGKLEAMIKERTGTPTEPEPATPEVRPAVTPKTKRSKPDTTKPLL